MGNIRFEEIFALSIVGFVAYGIPILFGIWLSRSVRQIQSKLDAIKQQLSKQ